MLDEEILELRRKLDESIVKEKDYNKTYKLSVELDELISKYYNKKLIKMPNKSILKTNKSEWRWVKTSSLLKFRNENNGIFCWQLVKIMLILIYINKLVVNILFIKSC